LSGFGDGELEGMRVRRGEERRGEERREKERERELVEFHTGLMRCYLELFSRIS